jgi:hypothetical protein
MRRQISSSLTFVYKVVFPAIWIGGFALVTIAMFAGVIQTDRRAAADGAPDKWMFLLITVVGGAFIYWFCVRLKGVELDSESLYISNFVGEIRVPLRDVSQVLENRWVNIRPVTIVFQRETDYGRSIVFMPKVRFLWPFASHPIVAELRAAVDHALGLSSASG